MSVENLRAEREAVNMEIIALKMKARELSAKIREAEGPIPDRSHRQGPPGHAGHTIAPMQN